MNACLGNAVAEARNARIVACTAGDAELAAPMSRGRREPGSAHGHIDAAVAALEPEVGAAAADKTATARVVPPHAGGQRCGAGEEKAVVFHCGNPAVESRDHLTLYSRNGGCARQCDECERPHCNDRLRP